MRIEVLGIPRPQGSKRVFNGRVVEAAGQGLKVWRKAIAQACYETHLSEEPEFLTGPVRVEVDFFIPRPPSIKMTGKNGRALPIVPPDVDKLSRACLDGISQGHDTGKVGDGLIWGDDSLVVELLARKFYADDREPGATITITAL